MLTNKILSFEQLGPGIWLTFEIKSDKFYGSYTTFQVWHFVERLAYSLGHSILQIHVSNLNLDLSTVVNTNLCQK